MLACFACLVVRGVARYQSLSGIQWAEAMKKAPADDGHEETRGDNQGKKEKKTTV
jgi:hypothetical protein